MDLQVALDGPVAAVQAGHLAPPERPIVIVRTWCVGGDGNLFTIAPSDDPFP
jgi:hypothetical protein